MLTTRCPCPPGSSFTTMPSHLFGSRVSGWSDGRCKSITNKFNFQTREHVRVSKDSSFLKAPDHEEEIHLMQTEAAIKAQSTAIVRLVRNAGISRRCHQAAYREKADVMWLGNGIDDTSYYFRLIRRGGHDVRVYVGSGWITGGDDLWCTICLVQVERLCHCARGFHQYHRGVVSGVPRPAARAHQIRNTLSDGQWRRPDVPRDGGPPGRDPEPSDRQRVSGMVASEACKVPVGSSINSGTHSLSIVPDNSDMEVPAVRGGRINLVLHQIWAVSVHGAVFCESQREVEETGPGPKHGIVYECAQSRALRFWSRVQCGALVDSFTMIAQGVGRILAYLLRHTSVASIFECTSDAAQEMRKHIVITESQDPVESSESNQRAHIVRRGKADRGYLSCRGSERQVCLGKSVFRHGQRKRMLNKDDTCNSIRSLFVASGMGGSWRHRPYFGLAKGARERPIDSVLAKCKVWEQVCPLPWKDAYRDWPSLPNVQIIGSISMFWSLWTTWDSVVYGVSAPDWSGVATFRVQG
eukprot:gene223-biopygen198